MQSASTVATALSWGNDWTGDDVGALVAPDTLNDDFALEDTTD